MKVNSRIQFHWKRMSYSNNKFSKLCCDAEIKGPKSDVDDAL